MSKRNPWTQPETKIFVTALDIAVLGHKRLDHHKIGREVVFNFPPVRVYTRDECKALENAMVRA